MSESNTGYRPLPPLATPPTIDDVKRLYAQPVIEVWHPEYMQVVLEVLSATERERDALRAERDKAVKEMASLTLVVNRDSAEMDALRAECDDLHMTIDVLRDKCARLRVIEQAALAERDRAMAAAQLGVAQCAQVQDALRRVLPMAEAWFRREFDGLCDHEPGECHCDREAHARTDINIALAALGKGKT